jgi:hypothetical protein
MKKAFPDLFHIERGAVNLARPTLGMASALVALILREAIVHFALSRALVAAFAMWLGWRLALALWMATTFLIVVMPDRQQATQARWQPAIGTVIGVAFGAVALAFPLQPITLLGYLASRLRAEPAAG